MKRIKVTIKTIDDQEMLTIHGSFFVGIAAERFVIDDQRRPAAPTRNDRKVSNREKHGSKRNAGVKGGLARAAALSPARRSAIARIAATKRWARSPK